MTQPQDSKRAHSELELMQHALCSWMPVPDPDPLLDPCVETLRWGLRERMSGAVPSAAEIRARYVFQWHKVWGDRPRAGQSYWAGTKHAISLGAKLRKFFLQYECIRPLEPYELELNTGIIKGQAAIIERAAVRTTPRPMVLDVRAKQPKYYLMPDHTALARWLAMREVYDGAGLGLVHLPLVFGNVWSEADVNEPLARTWLDIILKQMGMGLNYPRPGSHCRGCTSPCKEIFRGSDDRDRKRRIALLSD
jgi:hypothetical protein